MHTFGRLFMFSVAFGKFAAFYWSGQQVPASQWLVYLHILSHACLTKDQLYAAQCCKLPATNYKILHWFNFILCQIYCDSVIDSRINIAGLPMLVNKSPIHLMTQSLQCLYGNRTRPAVWGGDQEGGESGDSGVCIQDPRYRPMYLCSFIFFIYNGKF